MLSWPFLLSKLAISIRSFFPCKGKLLDWDENEYVDVFGVSDYELTLNIRKFNMVDQDVKIHLFGMQIIT